MDCGAGSAVRLLPVGTDYGGGRAAGKSSSSNRQRHRPQYDQHLPVRSVSAQSARHPSRGDGREGRLKMSTSNPATQNRRAFLKTTAAFSGGLVLGFCVPGMISSAEAEEKADSGGTFSPNVWLKVGSDDRVTIIASAMELGQGSMTAMPMFVAEELDVDWKNVQVEWAGADPAYANPLRNGRQETVASISVRGYWRPMREAGAQARVMLVTAAAKTWGIPESNCSTENGEVIDKEIGRAHV